MLESAFPQNFILHGGLLSATSGENTKAKTHSICLNINHKLSEKILNLKIQPSLPCYSLLHPIFDFLKNLVVTEGSPAWSCQKTRRNFTGKSFDHNFRIKAFQKIDNQFDIFIQRKKK